MDVGLGVRVSLRYAATSKRRLGKRLSKPSTPLLDQIKTPADLRKLKENDLTQLAEELRPETISAV